VLERAAGMSSFVASLSSVAELLKVCIDAVAANGVHWGTWSALTAALSYFLKSGRNTDPTED
jgi:hypothetical protein